MPSPSATCTRPQACFSTCIDTWSRTCIVLSLNSSAVTVIEDAVCPAEAGEPWAACPRSALKRVLAAAEAQHGLTFSIGHESEFVLLQQPARPQGVLPPGINNALYCSSGAYDAAAPGA